MIDTLLLVDTETQGLDAKVHSVLEIGLILWSIPHGTTIKCWSSLVQANENPSEGVNRIPPSALPLGLSREDAFSTFTYFADQADVICAHRVEFDSQFLPNPGKPWLCSKFDIEWPGVPVGSGLVHLTLGLGLGVSHAHRALTDCMMLARCFERVYEMKGEDTVRGMVVRGMRPKKKYSALVPYERKDEAKNLGFSWDGDRKIWTKRMAPEDTEKLPFRVVEVA